MVESFDRQTIVAQRRASPPFEMIKTPGKPRAFWKVLISLLSCTESRLAETKSIAWGRWASSIKLPGDHTEPVTAHLVRLYIPHPGKVAWIPLADLPAADFENGLTGVQILLFHFLLVIQSCRLSSEDC